MVLFDYITAVAVARAGSHPNQIPGTDLADFVSVLARRESLDNFTLTPQEMVMLYWAFFFLVVALIAGILGFTTLAGVSIAIAKFLAGLFLLVFLVLLLIGLGAARRV